MWIFIINLLLFPVAILGNEMCQLGPFQNCTNPLKGSFDKILTPQDVKDVCPDFIKYTTCLGDYDKACKDDAFVRVFIFDGEYESMRALIVEICDENSLLHAVLTSNIKCIREAIVYDYEEECFAPVADEADQGPGYHELNLCLDHLLSRTCFVERVMNTCGYLAKTAMTEILHRSFYLKTFCPTEIASDFAKDVDKLEMNDARKRVLRELLSKILEN